MPTRTRDCARALREGYTKRIDVGKVSFVDHAEKKASRYFLNVSSFGLSASIIKRVKRQNKFDWMPNDIFRGKASFAFSTLQEVFNLDFVTVRISIDGEVERLLNTINFCVANSRYFGGGMKIAPEAKLDDGLFDVVNIGDIRTARILLNAYKLYGGTHLSLDEVKHRHAKRITVSGENNSEEISIEADGEIPGKLPASYEIIPSALRVRVPKTQI
jgi:diacylglycerol kinase family enzyme